MKRDVKVGLLVAAVVCGVAAILLGGGLVGEDTSPAPALQVEKDQAEAILDELSTELADSIAPPEEPDVTETTDLESVALDTLSDDGFASQPAEVVDVAADTTVAVNTDDLLPKLNMSADVVLPRTAPEELPPLPTEESPADWQAAAPSAGAGDPSVPVGAGLEQPSETIEVADTNDTQLAEVPVAPPATGAGGPPTPTFYVVQEGDSFFTISKKVFGTVRYFPDLQKANEDINPRRMRKGMTVRIPAIPGAAPRKELLVGDDQTQAKQRRVFLAQDKVHVIQAGEVLEAISYKYYGRRQKWRHIVRANPGLNPRTIRPGMRIVIPALTE